MHEKLKLLQDIRSDFDTDAAAVSGLDALEEVRVTYLGRKGIIAGLFKEIGKVDPAVRGEFGQTLNRLKNDANDRIEALNRELAAADTLRKVDPTLPARPVAQGSYHPLTLIEREIKRIFGRMGFAVHRGPEVEDVWHNFDALNTPDWHPSRDESDTLYLRDVPNMLLRTETSPVQIRTMKAQEPPIRIIAPGRVFRNDKPDPTHSPMFTQVEGLYVDEGVTFADLKGTVLQFYRHLLGKDVKTRFRPHFFPFTEPSAEVDISCPFCGGEGCRVCKQSGWIEVGGSGMVDPNVLETVGIDSERYTGWAFGLGVERMAMLLFGTDDIRLYYENDIRFLQQFGGPAMKINLNWLREFVDFDESPEEIADILTFLNFECESITRITRSVDGVVVGKVLESVPHPNADKLQVTRVDVGGEVLPIVCGAPNCREGLTVAVATVGTQIGDITIGARKLRGELSQGMICSESEMGISENHDGIIELPSDLTLGSAFRELVPAEDVVLEFEVTVNRPDALSHIGMARELAAYWKRPFRLPSYDVQEMTGRNAADEIAVEILAPDANPRYVARKVTGVTIQDSPLWMKARLSSIGQRPISNVVDITNYILFELGQPLHAFDASQIRQDKIVVRMGEAGERFVTLDEKERVLETSDIVIADPERGVALGGVMGGLNSEVVDQTEDVIIEAAFFDPPTVRRTAKRLGLQSEASRRFERGADPAMAPNAAARCAEMFRLYAGAEVLSGQVDAYPKAVETKPISFRPARTSRVVGIDVDAAESERVFRALAMEVETEGDELIVTPPSFRIHDLEREIDLIEEIARHVGYDKVPTASESRVVLGAQDPPLERLLDTSVDTMVALGFREAVCSAMTSGEDHTAFEGGLEPYPILKPINPEMSVYRASLVPALLRVLQHNLNRGVEDVQLFETGQVGGKGWLGEDGGQRLHMGFLMVGSVPPAAYDRAAKSIDLPAVKSAISELARGLTIDIAGGMTYEVPGNLLIGLSLVDNAGNKAGYAGLLKEEVAERFGIDRPVYVGEIDLERWTAREDEGLHLPGIIGTYQSFSRFPASTRDLALVVPLATPAGEVEETLRNHANELLEDVSLFDLYEGEPLAEDERSLAWRLTFRAEDRTLTDKDIDPVVDAMLKAVSSLPGVRLRG